MIPNPTEALRVDMFVAYSLILLAILLAASYLVVLSRRRRSRRGSLHSSPYHCVSVVPGENACEAVHALTRERYFPEGAPPLLPVPGCTTQFCRCHYKHHADRRHHTRRCAEFGALEELSPESNRRSAPDRRGADALKANPVDPAAKPHSAGQTSIGAPCGSHPK